MTAPVIRSDFLLLDVTTGRKHLARHLRHPDTYPLRVTIEGIIARPWGHDDGTSQEFSVDVTSIKLEES